MISQAHPMTSAQLHAALTAKPIPVRSPWVDRALTSTLPAPTLAPTQADIDAELFERYRFAFRVRG
jgi:hypothetical protein